MQEKLITVKLMWLEAVADLIESSAILLKEGKDLTGQPPHETLQNVSRCVNKVISDNKDRPPIPPETRKQMELVSLLNQVDKDLDVPIIIKDLTRGNLQPIKEHWLAKIHKVTNPLDNLPFC